MGISEIIFGTMRMNVQNTYNDHYTLLNSMFEKGIDTHHISSEYDSYSLYQKLHQQLHKEKKHIKHITKIAAPDFKESRFNAIEFEKRIDDELVSLGKDQLEVVQWMFRMENLDDELRLTVFEQNCEEIRASFERLIKAGKVLEFGHFPYTPLFADRVANSGLTSLLITYLNAFELSYQECVAHLPTIAIRPLAAGRVKEILSSEVAKGQIMEKTGLNLDQTIACVKFLPFLFPKVRAIILSITNEKQLDDVLSCRALISDLKKQHQDFKTVVASIGQSVKCIS